MKKYRFRKGFTMIELPAVGKRACSEQSRRGFTLIELLIVISIISILATIIVVSYSGAQVKSRDNKRKVDVQAIASAYQIHYQETKTWKFSHDELARISGITIPGTCNGEGSSCNGDRWFNYEDTSGSYVSMAHALSALGYLNPAPRDPLVKNDTDIGSASTYSQYMKYQNATTISVYAKLENPTDEEKAEAATTGHPGYGVAVTGSSYGMNYAVTLK